MDVEFIKKINEKNQKITRKAFNKLVVKNEKQNFHALLTMQQIKKVEKHYDVFLIAAKIARGDSVSSDELKYIQEHASGLLADARMQLRERVQREREKKSTINQGESTQKIESSWENKAEKDGETLTNFDSGLEDHMHSYKDFSTFK